MDIEWQDGKLIRSVIRNVSGAAGECAVSTAGVTTKITVPIGESRVFTGSHDGTR